MANVSVNVFSSQQAAAIYAAQQINLGKRVAVSDGAGMVYIDCDDDARIVDSVTGVGLDNAPKIKPPAGGKNYVVVVL